MLSLFIYVVRKRLGRPRAQATVCPKRAFVLCPEGTAIKGAQGVGMFLPVRPSRTGVGGNMAWEE